MGCMIGLREALNSKKSRN